MYLVPRTARYVLPPTLHPLYFSLDEAKISSQFLRAMRFRHRGSLARTLHMRGLDSLPA
jgi:hypothetical protein